MTSHYKLNINICNYGNEEISKWKNQREVTPLMELMPTVERSHLAGRFVPTCSISQLMKNILFLFSISNTTKVDLGKSLA